MLAGKTILITGAGRGIGLCIAHRFIQAGASVVLAEKNRQLKTFALDRLKQTERTLFVQTDIALEADVEAVIRQAVQWSGRLDAVVHNAAIADNRPIELLDYDQWQQVLNVNLSGAFLCAKHAAASLKKTAGAIVLIASTRALMSEPHTEAYSASKAGLVGLTHSLAMSLAPVRVNCISPGWIVTDAWQQDGPASTLTDRDHAQHPVGRVGQPEDIAEMVFYLCSEKAAFITGQNFIIDGGMTKKMIYC
ncbi:MAG TPA: SDR family oxidoreductase [Phycisphaerales bacterium]|nr:SDR family oxidoreductase [Phycisphaerales bacterium]